MRVVHADEHLLVIDKPAGLLSVPGRGDDKRDCAAARVQALFPDALVVHRLDMATSGLLLMARGKDMQRRLGIAFIGRAVDKRYVALVDGIVTHDEGAVELPLAPDWPNRPRQVVNESTGKPSRTEWRVLSRDEASCSSRLELTPVTGRSHQLRVHLQAIGHPILGDALYAPPAVQDRATRLMLHATRLAFAHPATGDPLRVESPPPF